MGDSDLHEFRAQVKQVFASCGAIAFGGTGVGECVELIGELKELNLAVDGLVVALMGHVNAVQAAAAKERIAGDESSEVLGGASDAADRRPGLLSGRDATLSDVMARTGRQSKRSASNEVRAAQVANESFPRFVGLMRHGKISGDYLDILRSAMKTPGLADRARAEEDHLITLALAQGVDEFRTSMRAWVFRHAPARAEQQVKAAERREKINLYPDADGYRIFGWVTSFNGAVLNNAIRQQVGVPATGDYRDQGERNAQALIQIAHQAQVSGQPAAGAGPGGGHRAAGAGPGGGHRAAGVGPGSGHRAAGVGTGSKRLSGPPQAKTFTECAGSNETRVHRGRHPDSGVVSGNGSSIETGAGARDSGAFGAAKGGRGGALRHQVLVHVPLATLVRTEEAIEAGCGVIAGQKSSEIQRNRVKRNGASEAMPKGQGDQAGIAGSLIHGEDTTVGWSSGTVPFSESPEFGLDCPMVGGGLGRRGTCLDSREDTERDLGTMLGMIRAGIDVSMLDGFAPARLSDGSPLAPTQLAQLLCDSDLARVVFTAHGEPLDVSRSQRLFSPRQTKAVIARDMHCRFPGCSRGPEVGQVHHAQEWEKGGSTVIDNAVLLCFAHHRYVHSKQITISHHVGGFLFTEPDGTLVGVTQHASSLAA